MKMLVPFLTWEKYGFVVMSDTLILNLLNCLLEFIVFIFKNIIVFYQNVFLSPSITDLRKVKSKFMRSLTVEETLIG